jgi:hypothetical protein
VERPFSMLIAVLLLLLFVVPGIVYMIWATQHAERFRCPTCAGTELIPISSPRAQKLMSAS